MPIMEIKEFFIKLAATVVFFAGVYAIVKIATIVGPLYEVAAVILGIMAVSTFCKIFWSPFS